MSVRKIFYEHCLYQHFMVILLNGLAKQIYLNLHAV
jgi:hypothetical protein